MAGERAPIAASRPGLTLLAAAILVITVSAAPAGATTRSHGSSRGMPAGPRWTQVSAGTQHTCAIRAGGTLWCWGNNGSGQLGIGSTMNESRPQEVTSPARAGWGSVGEGGYHTCALRTGGTLWCWGENTSGELGIGSLAPDETLPQQVTGCPQRTAGPPVKSPGRGR
jgi:hypothetical protein